MFSNIAAAQCLDTGLLTLRVGLAAVFLVHGLQKKGTWKAQPSEQLPKNMLYTLRALSIAEPLGAIAMLAGALTRPAAAGFIIVMLGAINLKRNRLKMPFSSQDKGGWEFEFLILLVSIAVLLMGPGGISFDAALLPWR